jgi:hypothetical protein
LAQAQKASVKLIEFRRFSALFIAVTGGVLASTISHSAMSIRECNQK